MPLAEVVQRMLTDLAQSDGDPKRVSKVRPQNIGPFAQAVKEQLATLVAAGAEHARSEVIRSRDNLTVYDPAGNRTGIGAMTLSDWQAVIEALGGAALVALIAARGEQIVASILSAVESAAKRVWLAFIRRGRTDQAELEREVERAVRGAIRSEAVQATSEAYNMGRNALLEHVGGTVEYSSVLDGNTCAACAVADGTQTTVGSALFMALSPPNPACDGGHRCRCVWVHVSP